MSGRLVQLVALSFFFTTAPPLMTNATAVTMQSAAAAPKESASAQHKTAAARQTPQRKPAREKKAAAPPVSVPCGDLLSFQVLLDRQGFSPGQIDDQPGPNLAHALAALQSARQLPPSGEPDCQTWQALGGDRAGDLLSEYTITDADLKGPFEASIPTELVKQAALPALSYRSPIERLGERFHASPALLRRLNPRMSLTAGTTIRVPAVEPFDPSAKPVPNATGEPITIVVSRDESALRAVKADGTTVFFAPVTTGSEHDPLPPGDWKVEGVQWLPKFHYNPQLFWDAKADDTKATLPSGPNSPVGVVWIDLNLDHYGLHGTPEPGHVGHTESHGCVRLTNWDAVRVAALVKPGTPVQFR